MMVAIFCRSSHPSGYGGFHGYMGAAPAEVHQWADPARPDLTGAHGYVTLVVECEDKDEVERVRTRVQYYWQWPNRWDTWYSGPFDLVAVMHGVEVISEILWSANMTQKVSGQQLRSIGDNRAVAFLEAKDILE